MMLEQVLKGTAPGVKVTKWPDPDSWFQPIFKDVSGTYYGTVHNGLGHSFYGGGEGWSLWQELPKKEKPIKLEVGKYYKDAQGDRIKIVWDHWKERPKDDGMPYPFCGIGFGGTVDWYTPNGASSLGSSRNIVSEHLKPRTKTKWLCVDRESGEVFKFFFSDNEISSAWVKIPWSAMEFDDET